jgi:hypothetical protein
VPHAPSAIRVLLALVLAGVLAACGGESVAPSTTPLAAGEEVSPQRYLADVAGATAAVSEFAAALDRLPPAPSAEDMRAAAPELAEVLGRAEALQGRLAEASLADARLDAQRERAAALLEDVTDAMRGVADAAARGRPRVAAGAATELAAAADRLRAAGDAPAA